MTMLQIPAWPDPATPEGKHFFANAREIFTAWKAKKISNAFAFGMLASAEAESSLDPNARGDWVDDTMHVLPWAPSYPPSAVPTAFGLYQRHASRCKAIKAALGFDIMADVLVLKNTSQNDVDGAYWELNHQPWLGLHAIESQSTSYGAAMQIAALFERAGAKDAALKRGHEAERWLLYFTKEGLV